MTPAELEAVAHRWHLEVVQGNRLDLIDEILTPDVVVHFNGPEFRGAEAARQLVAAARGAFPDIRFTHHEAIASGERVAIRWTYEATHRGDYLGIPASGQPLRFEGLDFVHFRGGRISELWIEFDNLGPLRQAGVLPGP